MELNEKQRTLYSEKVMDFGNLSIAALTFGGLIAGKINWILLGLGVVLYLISWFFSYYLTKTKR